MTYRQGFFGGSRVSPLVLVAAAALLCGCPLPYDDGYGDDDDDDVSGSAGVGGYSGYGGYGGYGGYAGYGGDGGGGYGGDGGGGYGGSPPACSRPLEEVVEGVGFFEYEGKAVLLDDLDAEVTCAPPTDRSTVDGGAFALSVLTPSGARALHLYVDLDGDGAWQPTEPDWRLGDSRETYVSEHGPGGSRSRVYGVTPDDFGRFRSVEIVATGLSSAYQSASIELGALVDGVPCADCQLEASVAGGAFRAEGVYQADPDAPTPLVVRLGGADVAAGPIFVGALGSPYCHEDGHLMRCLLRASDFAAGP
ncbi:MAG TPA: hypothetical protein VFS43_28275 [Polyangiaceae bacterium]|nr:hypothetical protein [Polyangiaceae bacterium]